MPDQHSYDYILAGAGCAGLSLAVKLSLSDLPFQKVLLVDKDLKNKNDRTWCFWTKQEKQWYNDIIFRRWNSFEFKGPSGHPVICDIRPYEYCMIRGIDFYEYALSILKKDARFEFLTAEINGLESIGSKAILKAEGVTYSAPFAFNSAFRKVVKSERDINYVQHFKGWVIECAEKKFDVNRPVFMDFSVPQHQDCRFVYLLPFSENRALIEYTGFSPETVSNDSYDVELKNYMLNHLGISDFKIEEEETGEIPMYESVFVNPFGNRVVNIGTASGASKTSTGFTFYFIQRFTDKLLRSLQTGRPHVFTRPKKYLYYDRILLDVMDRKQLPAAEIFETLFRKNKVQHILAFLNEESTFPQELGIMNSVPKLKFIPAAIRQWK
jgi:lycopene beta-cyclase